MTDVDLGWRRPGPEACERGKRWIERLRQQLANVRVPDLTEDDDG